MAQRFGSGDHVYELVEDWAKLPPGLEYRVIPGVAVDRQDRVYAFSRTPRPVVDMFERDGTYLGSWGEGVFARPHGITIGPDEAVYCVDDQGQCIRKYTLDGKLLLTIGSPGVAAETGWAGDYDTLPGGPPFNEETNVAVAPDGSLFVSDGYRNCKVHHFSATGQLLHSWGSAGTGAGQFRLVHGVWVGTDGLVYVADRYNDRIQVFTQAGEYVTRWTGLYHPNTLCQAADGLFYVAHLGHGLPGWLEGRGSRVTIHDAGGTVLASWGSTGNSPDDYGNLGTAHGICVDSHGDVYIGQVISGGYAAKTTQQVLRKYARVR